MMRWINILTTTTHNIAIAANFNIIIAVLISSYVLVIDYVQTAG